jgi:hypothetical protein
MSYLYGDSTQSDLTTNFLELLRDALDFSVFVLQADEKIKAGKAKTGVLGEEAEDEIKRVERFTSIVSSAIDAAEKGEEGSPTAVCAARVSDLLHGTSQQSANAVRAKLASDIAAIDGAEADTRDACLSTLASFVGPHSSGEPRSIERIVLLDTGHYDASRAGSTSFGVDWTFDLAIPEGNLWASQVRIERLLPQLEIKTPQVSGWLSKEVKVKPQRIDKHAVTELVKQDGKVSYKLRIEAAVETGFDVEVMGRTVKMTRVGPPEDAAAGLFDVDPADAAVMLDLTDKLTAAAAELTLARLETANVAVNDERMEFRAVPTFVPVVERLIATLAPVVREIARRSLTPTELVLRRALADNRREEVFVTKATLREKYLGLSAPLRALFMPLGLDGPAPTPPPAPVAAAVTPPPRAELRRSAPPGPLPGNAPPLPPLSGSLPPISAPPRPKPSVPPPPVAPVVASDVQDPSIKMEGKNEAFVEAVKKIVLVLKSGRTDEGYAQYAELLSSHAFAEYRPDDQRQALKLLLLAKAPPSRSDAVLRAYKIALTRIQTLVDTLAEPADYEMLGVAHLQLDERSKASAAFDIALKLERARNPSRRISQLS